MDSRRNCSSIIYYGIQILTAKSFPIVACIICSIVSLAIGSSWSTMGTIGVALMGIGKALGYSEPLIAGAIISGAYLGDKMSPLSDTTNLAPAVSGTNCSYISEICLIRQSLHIL
jgi:NhaC family Na+:H+ antiporter